MTLADFTLRLSVALALGSCIGLERQWRQRMAGLRTNALVATGAALFVLVSPLAGDTQSPTRIAAQVVSGIGFLAGAVIFREGLSVRGLNTAATLWCTAAVGTVAALGLLWQAAIGAVAVLAANVFLRPIVQRINRQPIEGTEVVSGYEIGIVCKAEHEERIRVLLLEAIEASALVLRSLESSDISATNDIEVEAHLHGHGRSDGEVERIVGRLSRDSAVTSIRWELSMSHDDFPQVEDS